MSSGQFVSSGTTFGEPVSSKLNAVEAQGVPAKSGNSPPRASSARVSGTHLPAKKIAAGTGALSTTRSPAEVLREGRLGEGEGLTQSDTHPLHLLLLDEDASVLRAISEIAAEMGFKVHAYKNADLAEGIFDRISIDVVLMDLRSVKTGMHTLEQLRSRMPRVPIVVMTAFATVHSAVDAMRRGASDYLTKPFGLDELAGTLRKVAQQREFDLESRRLREQLQSNPALGAVFGSSAAAQKLLRMAAKVALASHPVLIVGESGTGKEMLASVIVRGSQFVQNSSSVETNLPAALPGEGVFEDGSERTFLTVDCGALSPALLETELFGYVRGEGTGERDERYGALTEPGGGSLLLKSISEMPLDLQAKLLRALQDRRVRPAGGANARPVTMRILAASSRDLLALVESGLFRKDLYFRLNVVNLRIPPLRERREDVPVLAEYFLQKHSRDRGMSMSFSLEAAQALSFYPWPGNVRELEAVVERACSISTGPVIHLVDLPTQLQNIAAEAQEAQRIDARKQQESAANLPGATDREGIVAIADLERQAILAALKKLNGDKLKAAKMLGIGKTTLYRKLKDYGIEE